MKYLSRQCLVFLFGALALAAHAQEFRVGFVNTDRIFREANTAKAAQAKLEQEFSKREKELSDVGNGLKSLSDFKTDYLELAQHGHSADQVGAQFHGGNRSAAHPG